MKKTLLNRDSFDEFLDNLILNDIPNVLGDKYPQQSANLLTLIFTDVIILGELRALHKLIGMANCESRPRLFEDESQDGIFYEVFSKIIADIQNEIVSQIVERMGNTKKIYDEFEAKTKTEKTVLH